MDEQIKILSIDNYLLREGCVQKTMKSENHVIRFRSTGRKKDSDGLYYFNLSVPNAKVTHVIVLRKHANVISFMDPNGKEWGRKDFIDKYTILLDSKEVSVKNISPKSNWNSGSVCAIWGIVTVVLLHYFPETYKAFHTKMESKVKGEVKALMWVENVIRPIIRSRQSEKVKITNIRQEIENIVRSKKGGFLKFETDLVFFTKKGQPYIKNGSGQCRFISRSKIHS